MIGGDGNLFTPASFRTPKEPERETPEDEGGHAEGERERDKGGAGFCFSFADRSLVVWRDWRQSAAWIRQCCFMGRGERKDGEMELFFLWPL